MSAIIEILKEKLLRIEREVAEARAVLQQFSDAERPTAPPADQRPSSIRVADKETIRGIVDETFARMGIHAEPVGAERLQQMMLEHGIKPEDNLFSRGLLEMREE